MQPNKNAFRLSVAIKLFGSTLLRASVCAAYKTIKNNNTFYILSSYYEQHFQKSDTEYRCAYRTISRYGNYGAGASCVFAYDTARHQPIFGLQLVAIY